MVAFSCIISHVGGIPYVHVSTVHANFNLMPGPPSTTVLVAPFLRPANGVGDTPPLPYYLYCLVGIAIMLFSVCYWAVWMLLLPWILGREIQWSKETLPDGTVLKLVRVIAYNSTVRIADRFA